MREYLDSILLKAKKPLTIDENCIDDNNASNLHAKILVKNKKEEKAF